MNMTIQTQGFKLTRPLEQFTRHQVTKALRCCSDNVERVVVRLKDINGPKGGEDKHCIVEIKLSSKPKLVITKTSSDMYNSVRQTTKKVARTALRQLKKRRALGLKRHLETKSVLQELS
jgi:putative sigma-54 modulation protein